MAGDLTGSSRKGKQRLLRRSLTLVALGALVVPAGAALGQDPTYVPPAAGGAGGSQAPADQLYLLNDTTPPEVTSFSVSPRRFALGRGSTPLNAQRRTRRGTRFRYAVSEPGEVLISLRRLAPGRRVGSRCRPATRRRSGRRCTRSLNAGALARTVVAGRNTTAFSGRVGRVRLPVGRYRASIAAYDVAGNQSRPRSISFQIVRPR